MTKPREFNFVNYDAVPVTRVYESKRYASERNLLSKEIFDLDQSISMENA